MPPSGGECVDTEVTVAMLANIETVRQFGVACRSQAGCCHTQRMVTKIGRVSAIAAAVLVLSACAVDATYSDLSRDATADDQWPSAIADDAGDGLDLASSRLVGRDGDIALYLVQSTESSRGICILAYANDDDWTLGCGGDGVEISGVGNSTYVIRSDGRGDPGKAISKNVFTE